MRKCVLLFVSLVSWLGAWSAPQDTAGPLTVRIDGPAVLRQGSPFEAAVVLENKGDAAISGLLRVGLIDGWTAQPDEAQSFSVAAKAAATVRYSIRPGEQTYAAHYPVHVFAEFESGGRKYVSHPVLIVETQYGGSARKDAPPAWAAFETAPDANLALWRLPVHRTVIQVFAEKEPVVMPVGWQGSQEPTRTNVQFGAKITRGDTRETIGIHPPWSGGRVGTALVEFPLQLPEGRRARLRFANALRDHNAREGASDGVTFRVRVAPWDAPAGAQGEIVFERHTDAKVWLEGEADLSRYAGRTVRVQLESHPGPRNNTNVDQSYWAEPALTTGTPAAAPAFPPVSQAGSRLLGTMMRGGTRYEVRIWPGERGLLDSAVAIGTLVFAGFQARVAGNALEDARSPSVLSRVTDESGGGAYRLRHRFRSSAGGFDLMGELRVEETQIRARFWLENTAAPAPWQVLYLEDLSAGRWNRRAQRVYAGVGNVLQDPEAFSLAFDGHRLATSFVGFDFEDGGSLVQAVDAPPASLEVNPGARHYSLHTPHAQTLTFIPSANVWDAVKVWRSVNGLKSAGGVEKAAGRFVFDLWGGRYADTAAALRRAAAYGLQDSMVVWHNWQRWGYDYRLPDIYPANPQYGTEEEFQDLVRAAKENNMIFAPHDNYIDFYPDAEGFSFDHIAFGRGGVPVKAWLNEGRAAQSYRWRADRLRPFLDRNLAAIRDGFAPTGYFIDVWSSAGPYDYWTQQGEFVDRLYTRKVWGDAFAWIREWLGDGAPQISESGHDQLIGYLDGAQTNHLRVDTPPEGEYSWAVWNIRCADAERVPWFDAAHHDRFVLHGAGYESRYASGLNARVHGIYSDDYMATEVLTGHPAMARSAFSRDVVRKYWLLHDAMREIALRRIDHVEFAGGDLHRQRVSWDNGSEIAVNRGAADWEAGGRTLPQYGFTLRVPVAATSLPAGAAPAVIEAAIERRDGVIVDWARSPWQYFVNARPVVSDRLPMKVSVEPLEFLGGRRFRFSLKWETEVPPPAGYRIFVHFVDEAGRILFQGDHAAPQPVGQFRGTFVTGADVTIPAQYTAGQQFEMRIGFYNPAGTRLLPEGSDDGTSRIRMGSVKLEGEGAALTGVTWTPFAAPPDPALERLNVEGKMISFDGVSTDGAVRLSPAGDHLWLTPLPEGRKAITVRLRWGALPWQLPEPRAAELVEENGAVIGTQAFTREDGEVVLTIPPNRFAVRLRP